MNTPAHSVEPGYALSIAGRPLATRMARVSAHPLNQVWPGYQRPLEQTELAAFAAFDLAEPVAVEVRCARPYRAVQVRPAAAGIRPRIADGAIRFTLAKPGQYTVELDGSAQALHLFADPPEVNRPDPQAAGVRSFGPGEHHPGLIRLESGQTLYLAARAVVHGAILAEHAEGIRICGRGILDGSGFDRMALTGLVCLHDCVDVRIEGITLLDSPVFTVVPVACRRVRISGIKIIGNWRYNSDGIDLVSCQDCVVEDSFVRTFDDAIAIKGYESFGDFIYRLQILDGRFDGTFTMDGKERQTFAEFQRRHGRYPCRAVPIRGITVRRCVVWNDWGRALEVGAETVASEISGLLFEDCDIIHVSDVALDVQNCDRALCRDLVFRDIRVEMDDAPRPLQGQSTREQTYQEPAAPGHLPHLLVLENKPHYGSHDAERGRIDGVRFERIAVTAPAMPPSRLHGHDAEHAVGQVAIRDLSLNGQPIASLEAARLTMNAHAREISIAATPGRRVLILGNSITWHPAKADIGWLGSWGMAASSPERDFAHLLLRRLTAAASGHPPEARIENIADFERAGSTQALGGRLAGFAEFAADTVILAIGENVPALASTADQAAFGESVRALLAQLLRPSCRLYVRSTFWADAAKDAVLRRVCVDLGGTFVDISALGADESLYARSERPFGDAGVAAHPGDRGMAAIAAAIWGAMSDA